MNIFVTVGSGSFDDLIEKVDSLNLKEHQITCQIGNGKYTPRNFDFFTLKANLHKEIKQANIVITHAGAGTIFPLLEINKKIIVIPNCQRIDKHQLDLANYLNKNELAEVCFDLENLQLSLDNALSKQYKTYYKEPFLGYDKINKLFKLN